LARLIAARSEQSDGVQVGEVGSSIRVTVSVAACAVATVTSSVAQAIPATADALLVTSRSSRS
jgi:hypothetical protein